jgi:ubiquinone/menaquinone biosynthesis C-methylase UbiE
MGMSDPIGRAFYRLGQGARVAGYWSQYLLSQRLTKPAPSSEAPDGPLPGRQEILEDLNALMAKDWANIEAGVYRPPHDLLTGGIAALRRAPRYFRDLPEVERRRQGGIHQEVFTPETRGRYPRYYLQNFHYQSGGWLSPESAEIYDHQVEVLFGGGADAMRRQGLLPLQAFLKQRRSRDCRLIDLGCGTGRWLSFVKQNYPRMRVTGLDLSAPYLDKARVLLKPWRDVELIEAAAEETGLAEGSADVVTAIYLFHELPGKVRSAVAKETYRLLKPGGLFILLDSLQLGDRPKYDALLKRFPVNFHEPYYADYIASDTAELLEKNGFYLESLECAYLSRILAARKP